MQYPFLATVKRNKTARGYCLVLCVSLLGSFALGCGPTAPVVEDASEEVISTAVMDAAVLDAQLDELLKAGQDDGMEVSVWVGGREDDPWYVRNAEVWRPVASAIKVAYLIELFNTYADQLDGVLEGAAEIVTDPTHPAIAHFNDEQQADILDHLANATVREVGYMMIRGVGVSNAVYNAAANVTTAVLGGPASLTKLIHDRDPAFAGLVSRRYMQADRVVNGDNEATAAALAVVLQQIAFRRVPKTDADTTQAMWEILHVPEDAGSTGSHYFKSGSLDSDPLTRIRSGFWESPTGIVVYVVMVEQPNPGSRTREEAGLHLADVSVAVTDAVLVAARMGQ